MIWAPRDELRLAVLWERGDSISAIARVMDISRSAVSGKAWRMELEERPLPASLCAWAKRGSKLPVARIRKLRASGKSYAVIGKLVGCHASTARRVCQ